MRMTKEIWKPLFYRGIDYSDSYMISNHGRLKNYKTGTIRKQSINREGYYFCVLSKGRKFKQLIKIHRAVAENFVDGDHGLVINHKDGNKLNNYYENLEFVTYKENTEHAKRNGLLTFMIKIRCVNNGMEFPSILDAMRWCGLKSCSGIRECLKNPQKGTAGKHPITHEPLKWEYV